jgi:hypothetical protein
MGHNMNHDQTRVPGRREPSTATGGDSASTEHRYQAWSASAGDIWFVQWSANQVTLQQIAAAIPQFQAVIKVVWRNEGRPRRIRTSAVKTSAETARCQRKLNRYFL